MRIGIQVKVQDLNLENCSMTAKSSIANAEYAFKQRCDEANFFFDSIEN